MKILTLMILGCALYAEETKPLAPQVSIDHKLDYQRARADLATAQAALTQAQKKLDDALAAAVKDCGTARVVGDAKGDPACPVPEKK